MTTEQEAPFDTADTTTDTQAAQAPAQVTGEVAVVDNAVTRAISLMRENLKTFDDVAAALPDLTTKYKDTVYPVSTTKGMEEAKAARHIIRQHRYSVQNTVEAAKVPLNTLKTAIASHGAELIGQLRPLEDGIDGQITVEEERKKREKEEREAKLAAERARIEGAIAEIRAIAVGKTTVADIEAAQQWLANLAITLDAFGDRTGEAQVAAAQSAELLTVALAGAKALAAEQERLAAAQAELERQQAEAEERRKAEEAEAARKREEEAAAERERLADERAAFEREKAELQRQRDELAAQQAAREAEEAEKKRVEEEAAAKPLFPMEVGQVDGVVIVKDGGTRVAGIPQPAMAISNPVFSAVDNIMAKTEESFIKVFGGAMPASTGEAAKAAPYKRSMAHFAELTNRFRDQAEEFDGAMFGLTVGGTFDAESMERFEEYRTRLDAAVNAMKEELQCLIENK